MLYSTIVLTTRIYLNSETNLYVFRKRRHFWKYDTVTSDSRQVSGDCVYVIVIVIVLITFSYSKIIIQLYICLVNYNTQLDYHQLNTTTKSTPYNTRL